MIQSDEGSGDSSRHSSDFQKHSKPQVCKTILNVGGGRGARGCYDGDDARSYSKRHWYSFNKRQKGNDQHSSSQSKKGPYESSNDRDEQNNQYVYWSQQYRPRHPQNCSSREFY